MSLGQAARRGAVRGAVYGALVAIGLCLVFIGYAVYSDLIRPGTVSRIPVVHNIPLLRLRRNQRLDDIQSRQRLVTTPPKSTVVGCHWRSASAFLLAMRMRLTPSFVLKISPSL